MSFKHMALLRASKAFVWKMNMKSKQDFSTASKFLPTPCKTNKKRKEKVGNLLGNWTTSELNSGTQATSKKRYRTSGQTNKNLLRDRTSQLARKKCQSNSVLVPSGYFSSLRWLPAIFLTRILEEPDTGHIQKILTGFILGPVDAGTGFWESMLNKCHAVWTCLKRLIAEYQICVLTAQWDFSSSKTAPHSRHFRLTGSSAQKCAGFSSVVSFHFKLLFQIWNKTVALRKTRFGVILPETGLYLS